MHWTLTYLSLLTILKAENKLEKNLELTVSSVSVDKRNFPAFESYIGEGKESSTTALYFEYNFGKQTTIVGDKDATGWGIQCIDTEDKYNNSCQVPTESEKEDFYYSSLFKYKPTNLLLRFTAGDKLDVDKKSALPVQLVTGGKNWPLKSLGVLGLAPQGDFAKYIRQMFSDNTTLLFGYEASNPTAENDDLKFKNHVVLNPEYKDTDVAIKFTLDSSSNNWNFVGDVALSDTEFKFNQTDVCFSSISNELIIVADNIVMCDAVKEKVCDGKFGPECKKDNANISNAPNLTITFQQNTLTFKGEDYIYFDKNNVVACRFGDLSSLRPEQVCAEDTEVAVGRLFFTHHIPALTFNTDNSSVLTLVNSYKFVEPSNIIWIIVGVACAVIAIGVILFILLKRRSESNQEYYTREL